MSVKKLLGLESFPIKEAEIMARIAEAKRKNLKEVVFTGNNHKVKIKLTYTNPQGCMRSWQEYFNT
tara:strand:- start:1156 stop:1353 length:198 start_codon:yes stop_codon:yes gene_type:complete